MNIGKVIRALRQEQGTTLESMALDIGSDASNLSRVERGVQQPSAQLLETIANHLKVSVGDLFALAEGKRPNEATGEAFDADFSAEAIQLRRYFRELTADNQHLILEFTKMLLRMQRKP